MRRRLAQISLAIVAVATLSACIVINSDSAPDFTSSATAAETAGPEA